MAYDLEAIVTLWLIRKDGMLTPEDLVDTFRNATLKYSDYPPAVRHAAREMYRSEARLDDRVREVLKTLFNDGWITQEGEDTDLGDMLISWHRPVKLTSLYNTLKKAFNFSFDNYINSTDIHNTRIAFPIWKAPQYKDESKRFAFMIMPFEPDLTQIFMEHVRPAVAALGMRIKRGDDIFHTRNIMDDVWESIVNADICIADCTGRNPNVFYEIGIAHTLGRKTILLSQSLDDIPFDIGPIRIIQYSEHSLHDLEDSLKRTIATELELDTMSD